MKYSTILVDEKKIYLYFNELFQLLILLIIRKWSTLHRSFGPYMKDMLLNFLTEEGVLFLKNQKIFEFYIFLKFQLQQLSFQFYYLIQMGCVSSSHKKQDNKLTAITSKFDPLQLELLQLIFNNLSIRCRNGLINRETFDIFFHSSGLIGQIIFNKFDIDKNGTITFLQFLQSFQIMIKGSKRQKADVLYEIYNVSDIDGITYSQLIKILFSYPLENLNQMLLQQPFLKFIGENQLRYYFGAQKTKIELKNIVEEQSQIGDKIKNVGQKKMFQSSILYQQQTQSQIGVNKKANLQSFKSNIKNNKISNINQKPNQKRVNSSILLSTQSFKKKRKNIKVSSNIQSLTKKYATFLFQSQNLDKEKDQFSKQHFYKLLDKNPALFNVYLSGFHTYAWQLSGGQPQYLSITPYVQGQARQIMKQSQDKVYLKLIKTSIFVLSHMKSKIPINIITLEGLTVTSKQKQELFGFLIKHRDGLYPIRQYYFKSKQIQEEWLRQLEDFKENSFIDNFIIIYRIGGGAFSSVFKGKEKSTNKQVAIKMIQHFKLSPEEREVIKRQCSILKQCHHPNIVKYLGQYKTKNELYMITELMTEGDLFEYTKKKGFLEQFEAAIVFRQLVDAILYVNNSLGIIHRDLKPENVMIIMNEQKTVINKIKLIDFGFGVFKDKINQLPLKEKYAGTTGFLAPEIYCQQDYDEKIDTFCLGIILYFLLSGYLPFQSSLPNQIAELTKACNYSIVNVHWSNISENAKDLISKILTFKDKRITTKEIADHPWLKQANELKSRIGTNKKPGYMHY